MIRVSYRRAENRDAGDRWIGVLQVRGVLLVACGHEHRNRDCSYPSSGESATDCARMILRGTTNQATAKGRADGYRRAWQSLARGAGFQVPASTIEKAKQDGRRNAEHYLAAVGTSRVFLATATAPEPTNELSIEEPSGCMPDWMLA